MPELSLESIAQLVALGLELVAMVVLSVVGLLAERAGFASLAAGPEPVAVWLIGIGAVALYAGVYMIGYRRILVRLRAAIA